MSIRYELITGENKKDFMQYISDIVSLRIELNKSQDKFDILKRRYPVDTYKVMEEQTLNVVSGDYHTKDGWTPNFYMCAFEGDRIVGFCSYQIGRNPPSYGVGDESFIAGLIVTESYRGQGIGKELLTRVKNELKKNKVMYSELTAMTKNTIAVKLYESLGFNVNSFTMATKL